MDKLTRLILLALLLCLAGNGFAQSRKISGMVLGADDDLPLPGVTIVLKGTLRGSVTDLDGKFAFFLPEGENQSLVFSFVGMKSREVKIGDKTYLQVKLESDNKMLDESIVIGYGGKQSREKLVGAVEQINAAELRMEKTTESFDKLLEGMVAGVNVEKTSGDIGEPVKIQIRGQGALSKVSNSDVVASSEPLYVMDGVPLYDAYQPNALSGFREEKISPLSLINPDDIESITILKDATASAIYGANASNGVVLITTKKGKRGKARFNVSYNESIAKAVNLPEYLNSEQYVELARETYMNSGSSESEAIAKAGSSDVYTDWRRLMLRTAKSRNLNLSISGATEGTSYRFSAAFSDMETISQGNDGQRFTSRLSLNTKLNERASLDYVMGFSYMKKNAFNAFESFSFLPNLSPYNEDGSFNNSAPFDRQLNPVAGLAENENWLENYLTNGVVKFNYKISEALRFSTNLGIDLYTKRSFVLASANNGAGYTRGGYMKEYHSTNRKVLSFSQLTYNRVINERHNLSALVGFQIDDQKNSSLSGMDTNLSIETVKRLGMVPSENSTTSSNELSVGSVSLYGRMTYSLDEKYNFSVNLRQDASSMFGGDTQKENFASFGASWILSKEPWFKENFPSISMMKLRSSYGKTGNSRIGSYAAMGLYTYGTAYEYNGSIGALASSAPNPYLGWEKNYKYNFALDVMVKDWLSVSVEHYRNYIRDAISNMKTVPESGFSTISVNTADMKNLGWEFTARVKNIGKELKWNANFNVAKNYNEITRLSQDEDYLSRSSYISSGLIIGQDVSTIIASVYRGVDPQTGAALYEMPDGTLTTDGKTANEYANRRPVGKSNPDFSGGFTNRFNYKSFDLGVKMTFSYGGNKIMNYTFTYDNSDGRQIDIRNQSINQMDRWQKPGDITDIPKLNQSNYVARYSTRNLFDTSNIGLKSISLGYNVPKSLLSKVHVRSMRVYVEGTNLGYWYKDKSKSGRNGYREYRYPFPEARTISFGASAKF